MGFINEFNMEPITKKILNPIGRPVEFTYPGTEGKRKGKLKDRAMGAAGYGTTGIPYWAVIDLIEFENARKRPWLRIGYYRKKNGLKWCGQYAPTFEISTWKRLFVQAAGEKEWFRQLLREVNDELK